jgi:hydroxyacylglutathione hydrolase
MVMKRNILILTGLLLLAGQTLYSQVFSNDDLTISVLKDDVWIVETADRTTMYIIEGEEKAMLIDTGTDCKDLDKVISKITSKPLVVVITHMHPDHAGNMGYFEEVWIHPADTVLLHMFGKDYRGKIRFAEDGQVFDLGGKEIEVAHMPGHTPGSIVLLDREAGDCYTGDAFGSGLVWLQLKPYSPMATYIASLEKMEAIMESGISRIWCGHYPHVKKVLDRSYITAMLNLAVALDSGTATGAQPYPIKADIGCDEPMIVTDGLVSIVYDPEHIK